MGSYDARQRDPTMLAAPRIRAVRNVQADVCKFLRLSNPLNRCGSCAVRSKMSSTLTVWYNTKCPVCNAGIAWQHHRLVRAARAGVIEFRDINLEPDVLSRFGAGIEDVRRQLHAVDAEGRLHAGADCAIAIWLRTPGDVWLGRALSVPVIHQIARIGYDRFAGLLYTWNRWQGHW
jgi:predicted DCC family thiol-disulfide oxidoreductase YuxK